MANNFQNDWNAFFSGNVAEGTVVDLGNGAKVTKMGDGTAVYQDATGAWVQYDRNSNPQDVARQAVGLAQDWGSTYQEQSGLAPFKSFDEYKAWEAQSLGGSKFNSDYEVPDYIRQMGAAAGGGNDEAFKRFLFFSNNPQYAEDYANIHRGQLSRFATDGSTLRRTDQASLTPEAQAFYAANPGQLGLAEGFNMDPNLYASRMSGGLDKGKNINYTTYLQNNAMDANGNISASNNAVKAAQWAQNNPNYNVNVFDPNTGGLVDNGNVYNATTGQLIGAAPAGGAQPPAGGGQPPAGGGLVPPQTVTPPPAGGGGIGINAPPQTTTPPPSTPQGGVPVYGPDGTRFPNIQAALAAGVYRRSYEPPRGGGGTGLIQGAINQGLIR